MFINKDMEQKKNGTGTELGKNEMNLVKLL